MIFNAPNTPKNRIAAIIAIVLGLGVGFYITVSGGKSEKTLEGASEASQATAPAVLSPSVPIPPKSLRLEDIDFTAYSESLAKFSGLEIGQSRVEAIDNVRLYFAPEEGNGIVQTSQSTFEREDGAVLIFGVAGLPDDSIKAEEIYLMLTGPKGKQTLQSYGSKIKCHRGDNTMEWQTSLCP